MKRSFGARGGTLLVGLSAAVVLGGSAWVIARAYRSFDPATRRLNVPALARGRGLRVERTVTVLRSPEKLYAEWKDLTRWPELVPILQSVTLLDNVRSRWVARGPAGISVEWYAELEADEPNHLIAWRSIDPSDVNNAGSVRFVPAPGGRGTEVKVVLTYTPPAGRLGAAVATIFGKSGDRQVREGLRRFKQRMEALETAVSRPPAQGESAQVKEEAYL